jgi:hypothetical protein
MIVAANGARCGNLIALAHDPEKCAAVFRKDHAQTKSESAMTIHLQIIAL